MEDGISTAKKSSVLRVLAAVLVLALLGANIYQFFENRRLREGIHNAETTYSPEYLFLNSVTVPRFREMVASGGDFLVSVGRPTCGDCRLFDPAFLDLVRELDMAEDIYYLNVAEVRRDADAWAAFKQEYGINFTPTYARYAGGKQLSRVEWDEGGLTIEEVREWMTEQKAAAAG